MPLRIFASRPLSAANIVRARGRRGELRDVVLRLAVPAAGARLLPDPGRPRLSADDALHRDRLDARLAARAADRRQADAHGGMALHVAGLLLFARIPTHGTYLGDVLVPSLLVGIGIGFVVRPGHDRRRRRRRPARGRPGLRVWSTPRACSAARSGWRCWPRSPPPAPQLTPASATGHAALTSGFQLAFVVAAAFAPSARSSPPSGCRATARRAEIPAAEAEAA